MCEADGALKSACGAAPAPRRGYPTQPNMGAGALAGFTIDFQVKATNVNNFLGANWFDIWKLIDTEDKGFVKTEVVRDFIAANAGKFTSPESVSYTHLRAHET